MSTRRLSVKNKATSDKFTIVDVKVREIPKPVEPEDPEVV
jgi:hypothetical protein